MVLTVKRVDRAPESLYDACANLFVELMKDSVAVLSLCGGDVTLMFPMARAMICACSLEGECYTAVDEDNNLIGFCVWMPPGKEIFSTDSQRQLGFNEFMARLPEIGKEYYKTTYFAEFPTFVAECLGDDPEWKTKFWWLHAMMVRAENQRHGVARALMQPVREKATRARESIALSTTNRENIPKYKGLGFRLLDSKMIPSPWGEWPLIVFSLETSEL